MSKVVEIAVTNFGAFLDKIEQVAANQDSTFLYRGQSSDDPLIPAIARTDRKTDTTETERRMLKELKRRSETLVEQELRDEWDWLVFAQHFGMKTRLLDWTSNPLTALWFACSNRHNPGDSFFYTLKVKEDDLLDKTKDGSPFEQARTKVFRPPQNNKRIVAQTGWFTVHRYSTGGFFVDLCEMPIFTKKIIKFRIPKAEREDILKKLNIFGISYQTLYPDFEGLCKQVNWELSK